MAEGFAPWCCPLCGAPLAGDNALKCPSGHSFDRAKEGYWHLLPVQNTRTKAPGDSREMVAARRAFLSAGYYGIFGQALYEHKNTSELFKEMQLNRYSIAIVLDEYGQIAGMITTEDLLEEIVGEIRDEYDTDEKDDMTKIRDNTYRINASCKLDDINSELGTKLYSQDNDSLGGFISEKLDRIPKAGDKLTIDNVWLFVERSSVNRAESIILKIQPDNKDTNDR